MMTQYHVRLGALSLSQLRDEYRERLREEAGWGRSRSERRSSNLAQAVWIEIVRRHGGDQAAARAWWKTPQR